MINVIRVSLLMKDELSVKLARGLVGRPKQGCTVKVDMDCVHKTVVNFMTQENTTHDFSILTEVCAQRQSGWLDSKLDSRDFSRALQLAMSIKTIYKRINLDVYVHESELWGLLYVWALNIWCGC